MLPVAVVNGVHVRSHWFTIVVTEKMCFYNVMELVSLSYFQDHEYLFKFLFEIWFKFAESVKT